MEISIVNAHIGKAKGLHTNLATGVSLGRGREEGGGVGSVRPACSGPEVSPSATCSSEPPAQSRGARVTAAAARQLLLPALLPTPGLWEVRPRLPHRASTLGDP